MQFTIPVRGEVHIIPPGKRKARAFLVKTEVRAQIPEVTGEDMPVALQVRPNPESVIGADRSLTEYRWDGENLWTAVTDGHNGTGDAITKARIEQHDKDAIERLLGVDAADPDRFAYGYENRTPIAYTRDALDTYFENGNYRIVEDNPLQTAVNGTRQKFDALRFVDGVAVTTAKREPGYEVDRGPMMGPPSVRLAYLDRKPNPSTRRGELNYYRADDLARAEEHAKSLSREERHSDETMPAFFQSDMIVDVFDARALVALPEAPALFHAGERLSRELHSALADHPRQDLADAYVQVAQTMPNETTWDPEQIGNLADALEAGAKVLDKVPMRVRGAAEMAVNDASRACARARARFDLSESVTDDPGPDPAQLGM